MSSQPPSMEGPKFLSAIEPRNAIGDWAIRLGIGCFFIVAGFEKFSSEIGAHWFKLFHDIGLGNWFRYLAGVVEILGGLLLVIPRTAIVGFGLLAATMAFAVVIVAFVLNRPGDSIFPGIFFIALTAVALSRRNR